MNKIVKWILLLVVIALVGYISVYFKKLSTMGVGGVEKFDAVAFTDKLWKEKLPAKLDSAIEIGRLLDEIKNNPGESFHKFSNSLAIGNYRYSLVKIRGYVDSVGENDVLISVENIGADSVYKINMATEFIYGNAIRDASGLVDIRDFTNTADLNNISEELNKKVRTEILPPIKQRIKDIHHLEVTGAIKFNKAHLDFNKLEVLPVRINELK